MNIRINNQHQSQPVFRYLPSWMSKLYTIIALCLVFAPTVSWGQTESGLRRQELLRVFLDGHYQTFGFDYIRTEITFVDWVRDPVDADVHIIVTSETAGSGGRAYTFDFIGRKMFAGRVDTLVHTSSQTDTRDETREAAVRVLKLGLVPYVLRTPAGRDIDLQYRELRRRVEAAAMPEEDPWDYWIFRTSLSGDVDSEKASSRNSIRGSFSARRVTEAWKINLGFNGNYTENRNELTSGTVWSYSHDLGFDGLIVKSMGAHWSAGLKASVNSETRLNQYLTLRLAPALEYSVFPYSEFTRRQLTVQYTVGANSYDYDEETLLGYTEEVRYNQTLAISYEMTQPWGSASASVEAAHYFFDLDKYHLNFNTRCDIRLFRGLSLDISGGASRIYDQLYIASRDYTDEEILLRLRRLKTAYEYNMRIGFSYTFGSIFNTVVNPRLQEQRHGMRGRGGSDRFF